MQYQGAVFTDLDGTLLNQEHQLCTPNRNALDALARDGYLRIVATGRSLFSAHKVLPLDFPIDYLIFSSGAGLVHWPSQELVSSHGLNASEIEALIDFCQHQRLDFMLHQAVPDNHFFLYHQHSAENADFLHRVTLYQDFAVPFSLQLLPQAACELIVIEPANRVETTQSALAQAFPNLSLIRATSPLDHQSGWLELFPSQVSKSQAAQALLHLLQLNSPRIMAIGNDYNDIDMLHWAPSAYLVRNAPAVLHGQFFAVAEHHNSGFAEAVHHWTQSFL